MGFFASLMKSRNSSVSDQLMSGIFAGSGSSSGKAVTVETALKVTVVLACVRVIAEGVAQVPLKIHRERSDGGSDVQSDHPLHRLLHRRPNAWQTSFEFRETMIFHVGLAGNFYAFKNRQGGRIRELIPFAPNTVKVEHDNKRVPTFVVTAEDGSTQEFPAQSIWHVKGPSWDTLTGMEAIKQAREAIGLAIATEDAHAKFHNNGAQTSGLYSVDGKVGPEQYAQLKKWIDSHISGQNKFSPLILDMGAKFTPTQMSGVDSQHLDTRKYQVEEICRAFRVMPIMIGQADKAATYASSEQMFLAHVVHTLMPWYERIEQSIDANLLTGQDIDNGIYAKFSPNALMRGAAKDRAEYYYKHWQMGALNPNEIRALEELNPYEGGDAYYVPQNMRDTEQEPPTQTGNPPEKPD